MFSPLQSPLRDFESPADSDRDNVYEVTVVATDDDGFSTDSVAVTVTVTDVRTRGR